jgi:hypothetical protein
VADDLLRFTAALPPLEFAPLSPAMPDPARYEPGVCNIGPAEIARRRQAGHTGLAMTAALIAGLAIVDAPAPVRFLAALPAAVSASGYLQARFHFCVKFATLGVFNLGDIGPTTGVADAAARSADRRKGLELGLASGAIGTAVGLAAVLLGR